MNKKNDIQVIVGKNVQLLRKRFNLTQSEFAEKLGISISHVANIERGSHIASLILIQKIIEEFEITPNELLLENPEAQKNCKNSSSSEKTPLNLDSSPKPDSLEPKNTLFKSSAEQIKKIINNNIATFRYSLLSDLVELNLQNSVQFQNDLNELNNLTESLQENSKNEVNKKTSKKGYSIKHQARSQAIIVADVEDLEKK